jgi:hypothetical protein
MEFKSKHLQSLITCNYIYNKEQLESLYFDIDIYELKFLNTHLKIFLNYCKSLFININIDMVRNNNTI